MVAGSKARGLFSGIIFWKRGLFSGIIFPACPAVIGRRRSRRSGPAAGGDPSAEVDVFRLVIGPRGRRRGGTPSWPLSPRSGIIFGPARGLFSPRHPGRSHRVWGLFSGIIFQRRRPRLVSCAVAPLAGRPDGTPGLFSLIIENPIGWIFDRALGLFPGRFTRKATLSSTSVRQPEEGSMIRGIPGIMAEKPF